MAIVKTLSYLMSVASADLTRKCGVKFSIAIMD